MIGSDILLYPDTGPEFLRALRMAVLYSERVHVLTLVDKALIDNFLTWAANEYPDALARENRTRIPALGRPEAVMTAGVPVPATQGALKYLEFVQAYQEDLSLLVREGVLVSDFPTGFGFGGTFRADTNVIRCLERWPPSYWDFLQSLKVPPETTVAAFQAYLCFIMATAQRSGLGLSTWSLDFHQALWTSVSQLADGGPISMEMPGPPPGKMEQRSLAEVQFANVVLERYLPRADDLPFSEILELRRRYPSELEAFRVGIQKLATEVDLSRPPADTNLQLQDLVSRHVDPAVRDLEASLTSARLNVLKNVATKESLATSVLGVLLGVAVFPQGPLDVTAKLGLAAAGVGAMVASEIERRNLLRASQWSILFRLTKRKRAKLAEQKRRQDPFGVGP